MTLAERRAPSRSVAGSVPPSARAVRDDQGHPNDPSVKVTEQTLIWLRLERVRRRLEQRLKKLGLPPMIWHDALLVIAREANGEIRATELERKLSLRQYQVSRLIKRLADGEYVLRRFATTTGKSVVICLTARGQDLQRRIAVAYASAIDSEIAALYSEDEEAALADLFGRVCERQADGQGSEAARISVDFAH